MNGLYKLTGSLIHHFASPSSQLARERERKIERENERERKKERGEKLREISLRTFSRALARLVIVAHEG